VEDFVAWAESSMDPATGPLSAQTGRLLFTVEVSSLHRLA
jgi:hypothetical protein